MNRILRYLGISAIAVGGAVGGCHCEEAAAPPPAPNAAAEEAVADPIKPEVPGWWCPGDGEQVAPPAGAFRVGGTWARKGPHWEDPPDESARFINIPGVRDLARRSDDNAWLVRHKIPGDRYVVLTAKAHAFPPGTTFDAAGAQKAFDDVAANPHTALVGARYRTWAGKPAVEGVVRTPYPDGNVVVHHLIIPTEGVNGMVMTYIAPEAQYHRFLGEACDALVVAP